MRRGVVHVVAAQDVSWAAAHRSRGCRPMHVARRGAADASAAQGLQWTAAHRVCGCKLALVPAVVMRVSLRCKVGRGQPFALFAGADRGLCAPLHVVPVEELSCTAVHRGRRCGPMPRRAVVLSPVLAAQVFVVGSCPPCSRMQAAACAHSGAARGIAVWKLSWATVRRVRGCRPMPACAVMLRMLSMHRDGRGPLSAVFNGASRSLRAP